MKIILSPTAWMKLNCYIAEIDYEISGLGIVEKLGNEKLYVPDIFLLKQHVTAGTTTLHSEDVTRFLLEKMDEPDFPIDKIKLWWHSHVNMGVFWSGTDIGTIDNLDTDQAEENWWISIVGNKQGQRKARLDVYQPHRLFMDDIPVEMGTVDDTLRQAIKEEIKEKVTFPQYQQPTEKSYQFPKGGTVENAMKNTGFRENGHGIYVPKNDMTEISSKFSLQRGKNMILSK